MRNKFTWEEKNDVSGLTKKLFLEVAVFDIYEKEMVIIRDPTSADIAAALNAVGAEAVREVSRDLEPGFVPEHISERAALELADALNSAQEARRERNKALKRAEQAERERDEAINRADRAEELIESACEPMDAARAQISLDHNLIMDVCELLGAKDEVLREAAARVVRERDAALDRAAATGLSADQPSQAFLERVRKCLQVKPGEMTLDAAERLARERDEAMLREKELNIFFRTADRVISEVRSALGIPNGPHVVEEVARMVKERDEAKRFMEVAHRQVDLDLSLITDVCEILGAKSADVLRETAARVVKDRDELYERSQAMITELLERLGAAPMEPLHDLITRVVQRSNESERIIASLSSSRKEFKDKLRECSQLLDEMREERDKAILKGLEEKNQTLGWLAAIPGVTVCALESVHDRIQRVKLEIDRLNRQLDLAKDRADKAEESRDEALDQLHEELRLAKEDRDLAVQKLQLMNAATLKNLKEFP